MTIRSLIKLMLCMLATAISFAAAGADASALMRLELKDGKVIAEIPQSLLGCRLMMATRIEQTSDSGEGAAGQLSDNCIPIVFSVEDKNLLITIPLANSLSGDSATPGIWKSYKVNSVKPDGTVVVDLTDLFSTQYSQLHTFPVKAYNSMGGQVRRVHTMQKDKSRFLSTEVRDSVASVLCDFYYKMDGYVMGVMKIAGDYSVRAQVRKMIFLPSTDENFPKLPANPSVAVNSLQERSIDNPAQAVNTTDIVRRWRIQPSDSLAWKAGEQVEPVRPIVFYIDTLMPENWRPYVQEGVLAWNQVFAKAGFKSVIKVQDFPSDPTFFSASPYVSRVIFAPSGMEEVEVGDLYDPQTGEIFSAQICVHSNFIKKQHYELMKLSMDVNPAVYREDLPDSIAGELVRLSVMKAVGKALGLRNISQKGRIVLETIDLEQTSPGKYEQNAIAWLYGPDSKFTEEEVSNLEYFDALDKWTETQKLLFADIFNYSPGASDDFVASVVSGIQDQYAKNIVKLFQFIGGYEMIQGVGKPYPMAVQSRAVKDVIAHLKDMDWFKSVPKGRLPYSTNEFIADVYRTNIFNNLLDRYSRIKKEYGADAFLNDVSSEIFGTGKSAKTTLMPIEMVWQNAFVAYVSGKMTEDMACYNVVRSLRSKIYNASLSAKGEVADHYTYLLFVVDKKLNE